VRIHGKVAIVTGAGSGFGEGIAQRFAAEGARVIVNDIHGERAERVTAAIRKAGGAAEAVPADVSADSGWAALVNSTLERYGRLDVIVNNAGWTHRLKPLLEITEDEFNRVLAVNVGSIFLSAKHAIPVLRRQGRGGCFIQIASTLAVRPRPGLAAYNCSKAAVINLSHSLAAEFGPEKVRFNVINPGFGLTGLAADFMGGTDTPEMRQKFLSLMPLGRFIAPADVANAALFLASDEAEIITGACLQVDAGRSI
jgi:3-oxoacyl-[acyl-carrier protein] reductase